MTTHRVEHQHPAEQVHRLVGGLARQRVEHREGRLHTHTHTHVSTTTTTTTTGSLCTSCVPHLFVSSSVDVCTGAFTRRPHGLHGGRAQQVCDEIQLQRHQRPEVRGNPTLMLLYNQRSRPLVVRRENAALTHEA